MTTSALLGLRAGLDGPPASRSNAASQLGISRRQAARIERRGLRALRTACGGGGGGRGSSSGGAPARVVSLAAAAPALQPAVYLPASTAPVLRPASDLEHPRGSGAVKGVTASSPPPSPSDTGLVPATATSAGLGEDAAGGSALPIVLAACLAALAALMLVGLRRRAVAMQRGAMVSAAVAAPRPPDARTPRTATSATPHGAAPAPMPPAAAEAPEAERHGSTPAAASTSGWAGPSADRPAAAASSTRPTSPAAAHPRVTRSASVVASGLLSFAVRELVRRRRRR
jgi:hypothetical protein